MPFPMPPLVSASWLAAALQDSESPGRPAVIDVRWSPNGPDSAQRFEQGHIPGAKLLDLDADLSDPATASSGRHPLPSPEVFVGTLAAAGVGRDSSVVAYDERGGIIAARLYWMLRHWLGHSSCAVLDGGIHDWVAQGHPLEHGPAAPAEPAAEPLAATVDHRAVVGKDEIERSMSMDAAGHRASWGGAVGLDARDAARYRGETEPIDPVAGHIPGARNLPCTSLLDPDTGRMLPEADLRAMFADVGVEDDDAAIASCGSGVTACHLVLAADIVGLKPPRVYVGSWSQWCADPGTPKATGHS